MGDKATREIPRASSARPPTRKPHGTFGSRRGRRAAESARFDQVGRQRALAMYADWTDRVAHGELPSAAPSRPQGKERNVVVTSGIGPIPRSICMTPSQAISESDGERQRRHLWSARRERRLPDGSRSQDQLDEPNKAESSRSRDAEFLQHQAPRHPRPTGATKRSGTARHGP